MLDINETMYFLTPIIGRKATGSFYLSYK